MTDPFDFDDDPLDSLPASALRRISGWLEAWAMEDALSPKAPPFGQA